MCRGQSHAPHDRLSRPLCHGCIPLISITNWHASLQVEEQDIKHGVMALLKSCSKPEYRKSLLMPLMGIPPGAREGATNKGAPADGPLAPKPGRKELEKSSGDGDSWLLRSPEWLDSLISEFKACFLKFLDVPEGAIFVSTRYIVSTQWEPWVAAPSL